MTATDRRRIEATPWVAAAYELGEGGRWVEDRFVFVDLLAGSLFEVTDDAVPRALVQSTVPLGAVAPIAGRPGAWIAAAGPGLALIGPDGTFRWITTPCENDPVPTRMNDAICDPAGRFWAGSMAYDATPGAGALYRVDADLTVHRILTGLTIPNGPAFTADGSLMYLADSAEGRIRRYDVTEAGLGEGHDFVALSQGSPDGMTVDDEGFLWVAVWGAAAVHRYRPDGRIDTIVELPAKQPTSVCLPPHGGIALMTTARYGLESPTSADGSLFTAPAPAGARPAAAFRGAR